MTIKKAIRRSLAAARIAMYNAKLHGDKAAVEATKAWLMGCKSTLKFFWPEELVEKCFRKEGLSDLDGVTVKIEED